MTTFQRACRAGHRGRCGARRQVSAETLATQAAADDPRGRLLRGILAFREANRDLIARDFPPHWRRSTGYSLNELLKTGRRVQSGQVAGVVRGHAGDCLAGALEGGADAKQTALVLLQFAELVPAMGATKRILECDPSAVELMDRMSIDLTRAQPGYASRISFIEGDPAGVLSVEFYGESDAELIAKCEHLERHLKEHNVGMDAEPLRIMDAKRQADVWAVRKAGLGLLYSIRGDYKPIPVIEDVSVPVDYLPEFVGAVEKMCAEHGTTAAYYAHASAGCLHIRPLINLKSEDGIRMMKEMADEAAEMAHRFGGVMSGEHGDGLQRSGLNEVIFGPELLPGDASVQGNFRSRRRHESGQKGQCAVDDRESSTWRGL